MIINFKKSYIGYCYKSLLINAYVILLSFDFILSSIISILLSFSYFNFNFSNLFLLRNLITLQLLNNKYKWRKISRIKNI